MRELHYENQGTNTYLVYEVKEDDSIDSMSLGMLTNNKIHGLAQTIFTQMDNQKFIKFNVSAKVSVAQFFAGAVNKKRLLGVFFGIVNAMLAAEDYMLDPASIIMDMNYIFTDVSTCETDLICLPIIDTEAKQTDLGMFFRNIMFNTQFDQTENCDHVAKIINYLNGTPLFSLNVFKKLLEEIQEQKTQPVVTKVKPDTTPADATQQKKQPVVNQAPANQSGGAQPVAGQLKVNNTPANTAGTGMNVPPAAKTQPAQQPETTGPEIGFFYLMQHYNKENAAAYKAQKEAKKRAAASGKGKVPAQQPPAQKKPQNNPPTDTGFGFAVPGASSNPGFAIPGQQTPSAKVQQPQVQQVQNPVSNQPPKVQQSTQPADATSTQPTYTSPAQPQGSSASFGETTVLGGGGKIGETTVLGATSAEVQVQPHLIRTKNNERINLNKPVFRIGKEKSYVDYFVSDNSAVSRSHCNIISRDGQYFIVDTNSTNHTYVNGGMIQSNVETQLSHETKIRLANEDFEFKLY